MAQREQSDEAAGWQHPLVSVLQLAGLGGGNRTVGDARARAHSVGDVKQIMVRLSRHRLDAMAVDSPKYLVLMLERTRGLSPFRSISRGESW